MPDQTGPIEKLITSRERDLGGFSVRRLLPYATHRMVGPFIFFDHMGPATFPPGEGMDVRPHPHINLATVTYLYEGQIHHRDSLGSDRVIEPGAINWMTAGKGIVHSERTPPSFRKSGGRMNGIQCWVALPKEFEEIEPSFAHHPAETLPKIEISGCKVKVLLGEILGQKSPVKIHSDLFYVDVVAPKGAKLKVPVGGRESACYVASGKARVLGDEIGSFTLLVAKSGSDLEIEALEDCRLMLLGGSPVGKRYIFWNFVSSSEERLEEAKREWRPGPRAGSRFLPIPGDAGEFIPLPEDPPKNPKGTIM